MATDRSEPGFDDQQRIVQLAQALQRLAAGIRKHRDARGDDRCWRDDEELYELLPEGFTPAVLDSAVELQRCEHFIACRQNPATVYVSPERQIETLRAEVARLRVRVRELQVARIGDAEIIGREMCRAENAEARLRGGARVDLTPPVLPSSHSEAQVDALAWGLQLRQRVKWLEDTVVPYLERKLAEKELRGDKKSS